MKYFLTIFVTAVVVFLGATVYFKGFPPLPSYSRSPVSTESGVQMPVPSGKTTVTAGGILSFKNYSVDVPVDWHYSTDGSVPGQIDKLTLSKGTYKIVFSQAAFGGGGCAYPGEAEAPMSVKFNGFSEVTTVTGEKLRVGVLPAGNRAVCESQSGSWGDITEFGHIDITNPPTPDSAMLTEIDSILSSLKKF